MRRAGRLADADVVGIEDPAYRAELQRADRARARAHRDGTRDGRSQYGARRRGQRRPEHHDTSGDPELDDLTRAGREEGWRSARGEQRRARLEPVVSAGSSAAETGATALAALLAWALVLAYLRGGTDGVRQWLAAKFLNRVPRDPSDRSSTSGTLFEQLVGQATRTANGLVMPVPGGRFSHDFGNPRSGGRSHKGLDIFAPAGTPVLAAVPGVVQADLDDDLGGNVVRIRGVDGNRYYYAHLNSISVQPGQYVPAGGRIGSVGATGNAAGGSPHLHFSINEGTQRVIDPFPLLEALR